MSHENIQYNQIQAWIPALIMQVSPCSIHVLIININMYRLRTFKVVEQIHYIKEKKKNVIYVRIVFFMSNTNQFALA